MLFPFLRFFGSYSRKKIEASGEGLSQFVARFDSKGVSEAQVAEFEGQFNLLTERTANLRAQSTTERAEATAITERYHVLLSAAEALEKKISEASADTKPGLEKSLSKLLSDVEKMAPQMDREIAEAVEAEQFLKEYEEAAKQMAEKLTSARANLNEAQRDMERAELRKNNAQEKAEQAAVLAGIRTNSDSMGVALQAMRSQAAKDNQSADALRLKAELLTSTSGHSVESDPNIAAAIASVQGQKTDQTLGERLQALKSRQTVAAA